MALCPGGYVRYQIAATLLLPILILSSLLFPADANAAAISSSRHHPVVLLDKPITVRAVHMKQAYQVRRGDTLSHIAAKVLGKASKWPILWWDNRKKIKNPNIIRIGQHLSYGRWRTVKTWLVRRSQAAIPKPPPVHVSVASASRPSRHVRASSTTQAASASPYSGAPGSFEACVIARESGGNPRAVNPTSGAGGLYQFLPSTWRALGFSGLPEYASVATQRAAFQKLYAEAGTAPWAPYDGCS